MNQQIVIDFAKERHKGQLDDNGEDYFIAHVCNVVNILKLVTSDEEIIAAAYLHDTLEDTNTTFEELYHKFGPKISNIVLELTHRGNKVTGYYFPMLHSQEAILIKFADRLSNLSRMQNWDTDRIHHYLRHSRFWRVEPNSPGEKKVSMRTKEKIILREREMKMKELKEIELVVNRLGDENVNNYLKLKISQCENDILYLNSGGSTK